MVIKTGYARFSFLVFFLLLGTVRGQEVSFTSVGAMRLRAFGLDAMPENITAKESADVKSALMLSMTDNEARRLAFKLYGEYDQFLGVDVLSDDPSLKKLIEDLELFFCKGAAPESTIYNATVGRHVVTTFGDAAAVKMFSKTHVNIEDLEARQAFIKELVNNKELFDHVESLLQELKRAEHKLLSFWVPDGKLTQDLINKLYFSLPGFKRLNKSALGLEIGTQLSMAKNALMLSADVFLAGLSTYLAQKTMHKIDNRVQPVSFLSAMKSGFDLFFNPMPLVSQWNAIKDPSFQAQLKQDIYQQFVGSFKQEPSDEVVEQSYAMCLKGKKWQIYAESFFKAYCAGVKIYYAKVLIGAEREKNDTACFMQDRLMGVATYTRALQEIGTLAARNPVVAHGLFGFNQAKQLLCGALPVHRLVCLLSSRTFKGNPSFFSLRGRVLEAYKLMGEVKDELMPCMAVLGELDACVAIAKLYKEYESRRVRFTWATYEQSNRPHIYALNFWNTMVDLETVVVNSIEFGGLGSEVGKIFTGSTTGGKSTLIKAVSINALFAQTITIVPADEYVCTPFGYLDSAMKISDDIARGKSHFKSEVDRADMLTNNINKLNESNFGLVVVDELFTGASAQANAESEYKVIRSWATSDYLCSVAATHFKDSLAQLERETQGIVKNYKMDAFKDEDGKIHRPFKIELGISDCNIAGDLFGAQMADL